MELKTPLYSQHEHLEGKIVSFAGYLLPVQYSGGVIAEHKAVRERAGIFDVSHMGEAILEGPDAVANLDHLLTNRFGDMSLGGARYAVMLYEDGGTVDDLIVYRRGEEKFLLVLNASNKDKDVAWIAEHLTGNVRFADISDQVAQIALQGPDSKAVLTTLVPEAQLPGKYYTFTENVTVAGVSCMVSRTGYTGEFGYELYMAPEGAEAVWCALLEAGAQPCGLGARDTLRLEAAMPLYGHELSAEIDPITAGLDFVVKLDKEDFIGKAALVEKGTPGKVRVGLKVTGRGIVREHEAVFIGDTRVGETTSGTHCPTLNVGCAMAYIDRHHSEVGTAVEVEVRGRRVAAEIVSLPFYSKTKKA
ncbi:Aminomethyltransferase [uncultured Eubacteriales bacterium]|uniref:Aminomethyltransferase n=1 Tax=uncultured Eubacteriales bacterium TaxID=172733 RepID=A0A212JRM2_9FIRM|nr:Aminomethyltransferase [uncultured Eubacteriales bacterium]